MLWDPYEIKRFGTYQFMNNATDGGCYVNGSKVFLVKHKGLVNVRSRAMQQIEGIGSERRRGTFCDKDDRENG